MPDGSILVDKRVRAYALAKARDQVAAMLPHDDPFKAFYLSLMMGEEQRPAGVNDFLKSRQGHLERLNAQAIAFRANPRSSAMAPSIAKSNPGVLAKANLDVGTLTNFAQITGGQALGYVSLDTELARGTVRPSSFTLYQSLRKSHAFQVVDYWGYASDTGGGLPGTAFASFASVGTGTLQTSAGDYELQEIFLKLAVNGRAITTALAAQNSFVDVATQENANAALTVLETMNWSAFWGDSTHYPNQFNGIWMQLQAVSGNLNDFQAYAASRSADGLSNAQHLFNLIYEAAAEITGYKVYGRITHAFMSQQVAASLQTLVTTLLNNIANDITGFQGGLKPIVVNGDLQGMRTRFGDIQFPVDIFINARDRAAQAIKTDNGTANFATSSNPTPPASVTVAVQTNQQGSDWSGSYVATGQDVMYAVASTDQNMNESTLTWATAISGIAAGGAYNVTINGPGAADAANFRVYRSGLGLTVNTNPAAVRYIGTVAASGSGAVTFQDLNTHIPGSETIFLLDLDEGDMAVDFRYLLPLTKIELFAQNLYMPWAVCAIGAVRLKIPKFNGAITNYVPDRPDFNPLSSNVNAN